MTIRTANLDDLRRIADVEARCFPPAEAAKPEAIRARLQVFPHHFWLMENEDGRLVSFINGMATNAPTIRDEMFENPSLHDETGDWQAIFGVCTDPDFQGHSHAATLMRHVMEQVAAQGRVGCILTCKKELIPYYERFGYQSLGVSASQHGGAVWYDMCVRVQPPH